MLSEQLGDGVFIPVKNTYHIETIRDGNITGLFTRTTRKEAEQFAKEWMEL